MASPELPLHVVQHRILSLLLDDDCSCCAVRELCKSCAALVRGPAVIRAREPGLPLWLLQRRYAQLAAAASASAEPRAARAARAEQAALLAARAAAGDVAGVAWLRGAGCAWSSAAPVAAAEGGHVPVLRWLLAAAQRPPCPLDAGLCALAAAAAGQLAVLQLLAEQGLLTRPFDLAACAEAAAAAGQLAVLEWLVSRDASLAGAAAAANQDQATAAQQRQRLRQVLAAGRARHPPVELRCCA